ncbi:hypothetical protein J6590_028010 [Homalodisca vitripennis]|nr:hypothetical protein J6590_028010 [Homalodisca vitripennis]
MQRATLHSRGALPFCHLQKPGFTAKLTPKAGSGPWAGMSMGLLPGGEGCALGFYNYRTPSHWLVFWL